MHRAREHMKGSLLLSLESTGSRMSNLARQWLTYGRFYSLDELAAAIEAEYRRQRAEALLLVQWWLRDVWLRTLAAGGSLLKFPEISGAEAVARRITPRQALENMQTLEQTQRLLHTNVQEALALEVSLLKLRF